MLKNEDVKKAFNLFWKYNIRFDRIDGIQDTRSLEKIKKRIIDNSLPFVKDQIETTKRSLKQLEGEWEELTGDCKFLNKFLKELNKKD